jgi:signal transduction histidine kinase
MKLLIAIYFFILAIIQLGLLVGIYHYYRSQNAIRPSIYWMASLAISVAALFLFGASILTVQDISKPEFNFTIANTLFYIAAVFQILFCHSLNQVISKTKKIIFVISIFVFFFVFESMRNLGTFEIRTAFMCVLACIFFAWQIIEINIKRKSSPSSQLLYLQVATGGEIIFALGRLFVVIASTFTIRQVDQIPQILILFTITQFVMNTLSYIAIGSYWAEQIAMANTQSTNENLEIKSLLKERDILIGSLLKANKTASTGALSASIAHELNQPLGASSLNIQFLQKKLSDGDLTPTLQKEVLDSLLSDNQRAANIISSLRSVFADEKLASAQVGIAELIDLVLTIARPEIAKQNIQVVLKLDDKLFVTANKGELQQVLLNLVNNAIDALKSKDRTNKQITIRGEHSSFGVQVSIADNGSGINAEVQNHMFELLSTTKGSGMGIGLWLCKHIVMRHGGTIWFESLPSVGTTFFLSLPLVAAYSAQ